MENHEFVFTAWLPSWMFAPAFLRVPVCQFYCACFGLAGSKLSACWLQALSREELAGPSFAGTPPPSFSSWRQDTGAACGRHPATSAGAEAGCKAC